MRRPVLHGAVGLLLVFGPLFVGYEVPPGEARAVAAMNAAADAQETQQEDTYSREMIERGKYLVTFGGCNDCHSPKTMVSGEQVPDANRLMSGHPAGTKLPPFDPDEIKPGGWVLFTEDLTAAVGPWGVTYALNLTPDEATGIGLWTEEMFMGAINTGKHMGMGRPIMPPMPWQNVKTLTGDDLRAVYAYLRSLPAVKNQVPGMMSLEDVKTD